MHFFVVHVRKLYRSIDILLFSLAFAKQALHVVVVWQKL